MSETETLSIDSFSKHFLHAETREWPQSNCSVDLWIEIMNNYGFDPVPLLGFTIAQDYEGDQFSFVKFSNYEIEKLYGLQLGELSIYNSLASHITTQLAKNNTVLVEVDGFYLPDTVGVSYNIKHTKTTIGIVRFDSDTQTCHYFHNDTYGSYTKEGFNKVFNPYNAGLLPPYVEFVKRHRIKHLNHIEQKSELVKFDLESFNHHKSLMPGISPIRKFRKAYCEQVINLEEKTFHEYAFNNFRMLGSNFELMANYLIYFGEITFNSSIKNCIELAKLAKALQFHTARDIAKGKFKSHDDIFDKMEAAYNAIKQDINFAG